MLACFSFFYKDYPAKSFHSTYWLNLNTCIISLFIYSIVCFSVCHADSIRFEIFVSECLEQCQAHYTSGSFHSGQLTPEHLPWMRSWPPSHLVATVVAVMSQSSWGSYSQRLQTVEPCCVFSLSSLVCDSPLGRKAAP